MYSTEIKEFTRYKLYSSYAIADKLLKSATIKRSDLVFSGYSIVDEYSNKALANAQELEDVIMNQELINAVATTYKSIRWNILYHSQERTTFYMNGALPEIPPIIYSPTNYLLYGVEISNTFVNRFAPRCLFILYHPKHKYIIRTPISLFTIPMIKRKDLRELEGNSKSIKLIRGIMTDAYPVYTKFSLTLPKKLVEVRSSLYDTFIQKYPLESNYIFLKHLMVGALLAKKWRASNYEASRVYQIDLFKNLTWNMEYHHEIYEQA